MVVVRPVGNGVIFPGCFVPSGSRHLTQGGTQRGVRNHRFPPFTLSPSLLLIMKSQGLEEAQLDEDEQSKSFLHLIISLDHDKLLPPSPQQRSSSSVFSFKKTQWWRGPYGWMSVLLIVVLTVFAVGATINWITFYQQTGSLYLHDYTWYSPHAAARRSFPDAIPYNYSAHCEDLRRSFAASRSAHPLNIGTRPVSQHYLHHQQQQAAHQNEQDAQVDQVEQPELMQQRSVDHTLPEYHPACATPLSMSDDLRRKQFRAHQSASPSQDQQAMTTVHVLTRDLDMLPWFWQSILSSHGLPSEDRNERRNFAPHAHQAVPTGPIRSDGTTASIPNIEPKSKSFPDFGIEFVLEPFPLTSERAAQLKNVLVISEHFNHPWVQQLPVDANVGMIILGKEDCNNGVSEASDPRVKFGFITYGDCALVDDDRWKLWPLGPKTISGFPAKLDPSMSPLMSRRKYDINMMMTYTRDKPSRMQAWLASSSFCGKRNCATQSNTMLVNIFGFVDAHFGTKFTSSDKLEKIADSYHHTLMDSKLTLCPSGKNPEQYRIWEAIMSGSIPVIEDNSDSFIPGKFVHPSYGTSWQCMPQDIHRILKETGAPVLFVKDWESDLSQILHDYDDRRLQQAQHDLVEWYNHRFIPHLRSQVLCQVSRFMSF